MISSPFKKHLFVNFKQQNRKILTRNKYEMKIFPRTDF